MFSRVLGLSFVALTLCAFAIDAGGTKDAKDAPKKDVVKDKKEVGVKDKKEEAKKGVTGAIKSVDAKEGAFTIVVEKKDVTFKVGDDTKFFGPKGGDRGTGKAGLKDDCMEKGYVVRVIASKDGKSAAEVHLPNRKTEKAGEKDKKDKK